MTRAGRWRLALGAALVVMACEAGAKDVEPDGKAPLRERVDRILRERREARRREAEGVAPQAPWYDHDDFRVYDEPGPWPRSATERAGYDRAKAFTLLTEDCLSSCYSTFCGFACDNVCVCILSTLEAEHSSLRLRELSLRRLYDPEAQREIEGAHEHCIGDGRPRDTAIPATVEERRAVRRHFERLRRRPPNL